MLHSSCLVAVVLKERARGRLSQLQCGCLRQPELAVRLKCSLLQTVSACLFVWAVLLPVRCGRLLGSCQRRGTVCSRRAGMWAVCHAAAGLWCFAEYMRMRVGVRGSCCSQQPPALDMGCF